LLFVSSFTAVAKQQWRLAESHHRGFRMFVIAHAEVLGQDKPSMAFLAGILG
jgi:hypothetical protein